MVNEAGQPNPSDDEIDRQLQQLVREAQNYTEGSIQRRLALNKLITAIQRSGKLSQQTRWRDLPNYEDFYNEALQQTLIEVCQNVNDYNPDYAVMAWVNQRFKWRFSDLVNKYQSRGLTKVSRDKEFPQICSLTAFKDENFCLDETCKDDNFSQEQQLQEVIESDPENILSKKKLRDYPQVNLKILLLLILKGKKWQEIATQLAIPLSTAASFYQRNLPQIIPYLQKYLH